MNKERIREFAKKAALKLKDRFQNEEQKLTRREACLKTLLITLILFLFCASFFDFYFDLNDDVLMKDILSGVYTGVPEARNIQMLFPISAFLSLLYRLPGSVDWYGVFLLACQFGSFALILYRTLRMAKTKRAQTLSGVLAVLLFLGLLLSHLMYVQYTVTTGMLLSAVAWLLMTTPLPAKKENKKAIVRRFFVPMLLIFLAFALRSEMTLLMLPFVLAGFAMRVLMTERGPLKERWKERKGFFGAFFGIMAAGLFLATAFDFASTMSADWHSFRSFFNARTELYDFYFYDMPTWEKDSAFYESIGVTEESAKLLENYNFSLDEEIDEEMMWKAVEKARENHLAGKGVAERLQEALTIYLYRIRHLTDKPFSLFLAASYILLVLYLILMKDENLRERGICSLLMILVIRSGLWLFILYRGRDPERITHAMLLAEILLTAGLGVFLLREEEHPKKAFVLVPFILIGLFVLPGSIRQTVVEKQRRERVNEGQEQYLSYIREHPGNVYFTDVYSTVKYSEKMFDHNGRNREKSNADLMGGWAAKSPLYAKRMQSFGLTDMQSAIAENENVYVISAADRPVDWLNDYYADKGYRGTFTATDEIGEYFIVYRFDKTAR